ncbi:hypothetical protein H3V53_17360 [Paraburkholderia bengalensis]|uniref:Uncharacterized protein n=1 Tax=Paraburkholderia bengalensis TaxID=2747562 RepID=A0ABU8ITW8_9BURK
MSDSHNGELLVKDQAKRLQFGKKATSLARQGARFDMQPEAASGTSLILSRNSAMDRLVRRQLGRYQRLRSSRKRGI